MSNERDVESRINQELDQVISNGIFREEGERLEKRQRRGRKSVASHSGRLHNLEAKREGASQSEQRGKATKLKEKNEKKERKIARRSSSILADVDFLSNDNVAETKEDNKMPKANNKMENKVGNKVGHKIENKAENRAENKTERKSSRKQEFKKDSKSDSKTERKIEHRIENSRKSQSKSKSNKDVEEGFRFKPEKLKIIPLGGLHEVGKNITAFEYEDEIIVVDCGLAFPEDDMLGIDLVIPDVTYLEKNKSKIKGLFITHGHEDHIGAIPYVLKKVNMPIYAPKLACEIIKKKLEEHNLLKTTEVYEEGKGDIVKAGKYFSVEFINSTHSIPDAFMLAIKTPVGTVVHTGDFKIDLTPIDNKFPDLERLGELGKHGVLALLSDSTNSERVGYTASERTVGDVFEKSFRGCQKRVIVATFASNVHRVQQIVNATAKYGRKIAICGRSMINIISIAKEFGYIDLPDNMLIDIDMIKNYPDNQVCILTTGSQGEPMSALTRMSIGEHRKIQITPNDLIIVSANPIPGNEKYVANVVNDLMELGAEVIYNALEKVHVSGHAAQEEQKLLLALVKPKFFLPVHGEYKHQVAHMRTAIKMQIPRENIFIMDNGDVLELDENEAKIAGKVQSGKILVDGLGVGDVGNIVLRDRQHLSQDGLIIIVMTMDSSTGTMISGPDVISRGFVYVRESEDLMENVNKIIKKEVESCEEQHITDWTIIKSEIRDSLREYIARKTKRNPMILPIIMEV